MARPLLCEIVTPESILYTNEVQMVVATTPAGEVGILPLHTPIVTTLAPGEVRLKTGDGAADWEWFSIAGGYLQVHEDKVIVLADAAVAVSQIDAARAKESKALIEARLAELPPDAEGERAEMIRDLSWTETQIKVAEKRGGATH
jgi:F-type H+-transporting ATPase subunit epsilon